MKFKKSIILFGIIVLVIILFRGHIYRALVNYREIGIREPVRVTNKDIIREINNRIDDRKLDLEEIANISQEIAKDKLKFTFKKTSHNQNVVYDMGEANCMGYSSLCNAIGNFIIKKQKDEDRYVARHIYGKLEIFGIDLNGLFKSNFFKTHDYNEIREYKANRSIFFDPSIGDYLKIKKVSSKE